MNHGLRLGSLALILFARAAVAETPSLPAGMVLIPAGNHRPVIRAAQAPESVPVPEFHLDVQPVTNREFLAFVRANPKWCRSQVSRLFADSSYLANWTGDLDLGPKAPPDSPVIHVSWFAARSYAHWVGKRLPTTTEWEYAASVGYSRPDGKKDPELNREIYTWLSRPVPDVLPAVATMPPNFHGIRGLHGLVWEWVEDFNTAMIAGDSRSDSDFDRDLFCGAGSIGTKDPNDYAAFMRQALRASLHADNSTSSLGFRCARDSAVKTSSIP